MPDYFRAVALDFDGTLTDGEQPSSAVLAALAEARARGRRLVLVTGRTLRHLRAGFADVDNWFDAIVAENGAVLHTRAGSQVLAQPIDPALADALTGRGVRVDRGRYSWAARACRVTDLGGGGQGCLCDQESSVQ